jgi:methionyl-tRNA synthetase
MSTKKKYLVTSALPYANGPIHFGHLAGAYLPADIYVRHRRMQGHEVKFISGSDEHGVGITKNAREKNKKYQDYVDKWHKSHAQVFKDYNIEFDFFGRTSSDYHAEEVLRWFNKLYEKGLIEKKDGKQLQCQDCNNYLPDRFVEGKCYECGFEHARGDECPKCGTWIEPLKLIDPVCQFCKSSNIEAKDTFQYHLMLSKLHPEYREWFKTKQDWRKTVYSFVDSLSKDELVNRAITRDLDWGIDVPLDEAIGKKLYVWFDAPIGYVSNLKQHLEDSGSSDHYLNDWWNNADVNITNFIGKDNIIFHAIIFPVMSLGSGYARMVDDLPANQYVNLEGKQFSKSSGWYVDAQEALKEFSEDAFRYYLASIIPETSDSSFSWTGFENKVNGELANNIGNFVNRSMKFLKKTWPEGVGSDCFQTFFESENSKALSDKITQINEYLNDYQIKKALDTIMSIGRDANEFFSEREPWAMVKTDMEKTEETMAWSAIYVFSLGVMFKPFLPNLSSRMLKHFGALVTTESMQELYTGNVAHLRSIFSQNFVVEGKVKGLVPKIDSDIIKELEAKLKAL